MPILEINRFELELVTPPVLAVNGRKQPIEAELEVVPKRFGELIVESDCFIDYLPQRLFDLT